ncbi:MAG: hypothetical protein M3R63_05520 [Actinomycetota bacterium]|nr:hypothetical protein [Actinomycetota bacterium]
MLRSRLRFLAVLAAMAALLVGCGGGDAAERPAPAGTADPVAWAEAYCSGATAAKDAALAALTVPQTEPAAQKQALGDFLVAAEAAYQDSLQRLQQLNAPAVDAGRMHHETALDLYRSQLDSVQTQQEDLAALDPAAPDFTQRLTEIVSSTFDRRQVQERTDAISTDPQLAPALQQAPMCQQGRPGGGG